MITEQNYVGKGSSANTPPQTAKNTARSSLPADSRPALSAVGAEQIQVNKTVYEAQTELLELVDDFLLKGKGVTPIEAINELMYEWLVTPAAILVTEHNEAKLWIVLELSSFLSKLKQYANNVDYLVEEAHKEGVLYGQQ